MSGAAGSESTQLEQAADTLLSGLSQAAVLAAMTPQLPDALMSAVISTARRRDVQLTLLVADLPGRWTFIDQPAHDAAASGRLRLVSVAGAVPRRLAGLVESLPVSLWHVDQLIAAGELPVDIFLARVGAGSTPRQVTYGDMIGYSASALSVAGRIGFEVVPQLRVHPGTDGIPLERATVVVHRADVPPAPAASASPTPTQQAIGRRVAALIPDGATLQLGVGAVPAATVEQLAGKADLGLQSGVLPGSVQRLIASGVVNGRRKTAERGRHVATGLLGGTPDGWDENVLLRPVLETHHPARLLEHDNLWAINSAFEVDLAGQANAEFAVTPKWPAAAARPTSCAPPTADRTARPCWRCPLGPPQESRASWRSYVIPSRRRATTSTTSSLNTASPGCGD